MGNSPRYVGFIDPPYIVTLTDDSGAALNLTGCTSNSFTLTMLNQNTGLSQQGVGVWTVTDATNGKASYQWTNADMATAGPWWIYSTVKLPSEPSPREFDPELILILSGTVGVGAAPPGVLPAPIAAALYINVRDYGALPSNTAAQNDIAFAAALNALTPCDVKDGANNLVSGKTGVLFFPPGVYQISSLLTLPPGTITFQGSGMSSWIPIMDTTPYENLGGTAIVTSSTAGLISIPQDSFNEPATNFYLRDMDLRVVSPTLPAGSSAPAVLNLKGWISGEIRNVNVLEVKTAGGIGQNLYRMIDCSPGSAKDTTVLQNVRGFGGTIAILFAGAHIIAIGITAGFTGTANGSWSNSITIAYDLGCYYADLHVFASPYGLSLSTSSVFQPLVIYGVMFESCTHYMRPEFGGMSGTIILEGPCWDSTPDPLTDIPANMASTTNIITKYESDVTGTNTSKHITVAASSQTAGASPYTLTKQPYDQIAVITTVGGMTALTLDGQALFNNAFSVGQQVFVGAGHTLIATWATTAPVFRLLPQ